MREYNKPEFFVTEFAANHAISSCPVNDTYKPVTVDCVITGSHAIFYGNCSSNYNNLTVIKNFYTTTNGTTSYNDYLVWGGENNWASNKGTFDASNSIYEGFSGHDSASAFITGTTEDKRHSLLDKLMEIVAGAKDNDEKGGKDVHGGMITPDIVRTQNSSL